MGKEISLGGSHMGMGEPEPNRAIELVGCRGDGKRGEQGFGRGWEHDGKERAALGPDDMLHDEQCLTIYDDRERNRLTTSALRNIGLWLSSMRMPALLERGTAPNVGKLQTGAFLLFGN